MQYIDLDTDDISGDLLHSTLSVKELRKEILELCYEDAQVVADIIDRVCPEIEISQKTEGVTILRGLLPRRLFELAEDTSVSYRSYAVVKDSFLRLIS